MPQYLPLPDGNSFEIPEGVDADMAWAMAKDKYPDSFKPPKGGFKAAFGSGIRGLEGALELGKAGLGLKSNEEAEAARALLDQEDKRKYKPESKGFAETPWAATKEMFGSSLPYMAAPLIAGGAATVLGAPALAATGLGGLASAAQFTLTNADRQVNEKTKIADIDWKSAGAAAIPQAALDMIGFKMMPGIRQIMQLAGKEVTEEAAKRIATQGVKQIAADYAKTTGKAMGAEGITEAAQQVLERMQAGLNLTDEKARDEYFQSLIGGAVLGGALSPAGRFVERSGERTQQENKIKLDEQKTQQAAADALAAQRSTPEYIKDLAERFAKHGPKLAELQAAAEAKYDKNDMLATAAHKEAVAALNEYRNSDEVRDLRTEVEQNRGSIEAAEKHAAEEKAAKIAAEEAEASRPRTPEEVAQMQSQLEEAQAGLAQATETAKAAIRSGDTASHDTALEAARKHRASIDDLTARIPPPAPPAPTIPALDKLNKSLQGRLKAYDGAIGTDPDAAASIAEQIRTLQAQIKEVSPTYAELAGRQDLLKQQKPSKNPVNPMARFMEDNDALDSQRVESEGMRNTAENDRLVQKMGEKELNTGVTEQRTLFDEAPQLRNQTVSGSGAQGKSRAELMAELQIARATGNKAAANAAVEQLQVLKATPPTTGALGMDPSLNAALGVGSVAKNDAAAQTAADNRASAYAKLVQLLDRSNRGLASKEETVAARATVIRSMLEEIEAQRGTPLSNTEKTKITGQVAAPLNELMNRFGDTRDMTKVITGKDTSYLEPAQYENGQWTQQNKNVWGWFDPGMPTVEGRAEGRRTFGNPYAAVQAIGEQLHDIRNAAVHGASAATAVDTTYTTKETSPAALRDAVARLPQNDAFVQRVQDNLPALARHAPEDVAAWAHAMRTGNKADAHAQRVTTALDGLEQGKRSDEQGVQKDAFPDEALQGKAFASRAEFDRYLASDATHQMRADIGLVQQTASRLAARIAPFEKKAAGLRKQVEAAEARVSASDAEAASAQERMETITTRLSNELADLTLAHEQARSAFEQAVKKSRDTSELIHDNQSEFEQQHAAVEAAAQAVVDAKEAMVKAMLKDVSKKNYDSLRKAQAGVVDAVSKHFDMTGELDATTLTFLRADLRLQMDLQEQLANLRGMSDTMTQAARDLDAARAVQERSTKNRRELKAARDGIAAAQEEMIAARGNQDKHRTAFNKLERAIEVHKEAMRSAAEARRAPAAVDSGAISAREGIDGAQRAEEQAHLERREDMPGERIDNSKYRAARDAAPVDQTRVDRKAQLELKAADTTLPKTTRDKARRTFLAMEREDSASEQRSSAEAELDRLVEERIPELEKQVREGATDSNKQELAKAKRSIAKLASLLQRAKRTPVGRVEGPVRPVKTEPIVPGERSELVGRVTQAGKKERIAGEQRTASEESRAGKNKTGTRNKVVEQRKIVEPNRAISKDEMQVANAEAADLTPTPQGQPLRDPVAQEINAKRDAEAREAQDAQVAKYTRLLEAAETKLAEAEDAAFPPTAEAMDRMIARKTELQKDLAHAKAMRAMLERRNPDKAKPTEPQASKEDANAALADNELEAYDDIPDPSPYVDDFGGEYEASVFRTATASGPGMKTAEVTRLANRITEGWTNTPDTVVVDKESDLPQRIQDQAKRDGMTGKIPGLFDPDTGKVYLVAENLHNGNDVALTIVHEVAGHYGLRDMLGKDYSDMMRRLYDGNADVRARADEHMKGDGKLSKEVAVEEALAEMAETVKGKSGVPAALTRTFYAIKQWLWKKLGLKGVTDGEVAQIVANARRHVKRGEAKGAGTAGEAVYRGGAVASNALDALSDKVIAKPKTMRERMGNFFALETEMQLVDMRAGIREALKTGDHKNYTQAMSDLVLADQKSTMASAALTRGYLVNFKDEKGYHGTHSSGKVSGKDVFEAIADVPGKDATQRANRASIYMIAQRAANKGLSKLDLKALGVTQSDVTAAMAAANADPVLKKSLEKVRSVYNEYNAGMVHWLADTGAIPKKLAQDLLADGDYVPYYRVSSNGTAELHFGNEMTITIGDVRHQPYLQALKGGEEKILPLTESLQQNTLLLVDKGLTNQAQKSIAYALQAIGRDAKGGRLMKIHAGKSPADPGVIRFNQEPDPSNANDDGGRWIKVQTDGTIMDGIPAELVVKSIEGAHLMLPSFLKLGAAAADLLRSGITRTPLYIARQLVRDPMASTFTSGINYSPLKAVLKAGMKFIDMNRKDSATEAVLIEKGLVHSGIFQGDYTDMKKQALQLASGKDQTALNRLFAALDRGAMRADGATRALVYENAIGNGMSEVEASMMVRESMNFSKRGLSQTVQHAARLIPFFNAQIQALNVLAKAARGNMPFEEQQDIKRKFFNNAMLLAGTGMAYAMAMQDDDYYKNARPRDRYTNFFVPMPGGGEPIKIPIPYEVGYFFSVAVAAVDAMMSEVDTKAQAKALGGMFLNSVPGLSSAGVPQLVKPLAEVATGTNFFTWQSVEPERLKGLDPDKRYVATTTELAKRMSELVPGLSPIQIEHIAKGYLGIIPLAIAAATNEVFATTPMAERASPNASDTPLVGSAFQKRYGGGDADVVYDLANDAVQAKRTLDRMQKAGQVEEARQYREDNKARLAAAAAGSKFKDDIGKLNADIERIKSHPTMDAQTKREHLDMREQTKETLAKEYLKIIKRIEASAA